MAMCSSFARACISVTVGPDGTGFRRFIPLDRLLSAEVGPVENLLQANDLRTIGRGFANQAEVLFNHGLFLSRPTALSPERHWKPE